MKFLTKSNRGTLKSKLQPLTVYHGHNTCQICFVSSDQRNLKRRNFKKLTDLCQFQEVAEAWQKVDPEYNKVNQMMDW